ncbi:hypothetical protein QNO09_10935 [Streptomyces sp. 378]|uniref:hypothetical protein n=1 Tax=Streptomyces sp. 378 TaxID=3049412 RepID=UPI0024C458FF|nr:hypothetical protein [Streptomyces sp. 378]MDK1343814.1 hypothetical protein [Streptomyces sp. 378]
MSGRSPYERPAPAPETRSSSGAASRVLPRYRPVITDTYDLAVDSWAPGPRPVITDAYDLAVNSWAPGPRRVFHLAYDATDF